jgi:hypothetical protein
MKEIDHEADTSSKPANVLIVYLSRTNNTKAIAVERDGVYFVMEGEKLKEAETEVKAWLRKIKLLR